MQALCRTQSLDIRFKSYSKSYSYADFLDSKSDPVLFVATCQGRHILAPSYSSHWHRKGVCPPYSIREGGSGLVFGDQWPSILKFNPLNSIFYSTWILDTNNWDSASFWLLFDPLFGYRGIRAEVLRSFITTTVQEEFQVTPQGRRL